LASLAQFDRRRGAERPGVVGVDEAGRGSLCGPVVAAAVLLDAGFYGEKSWLRKVAGADDSKRLTAERRTELRAAVGELQSAGRLRCAWASASVLEISAHNILGATRLAMARCVAALAQGPLAPLFAAAGTEGELFGHGEGRTFLVLVDGLPLRPFAWAHEAVKGGDGKSLAIALASIVAKVERDRLLVEMDARHPEYGFAVHKGYGTPDHIEALRRLGPCPEHRDLFVRRILAGEEQPPEAQDEFSFE
jgi:ribonuclease HII